MDALEKARADLARLTAAKEAIEKRDANRHWTELDSATGSGIRRKPNPKADAQRFNRYARESQIFVDFEAAVKRVAELERREADKTAEAARVRFTADDLRGARAVRDKYGWHKVARVNKTTVSVETGYSWTDRIKLNDVLQVVR